VEEHESVEQSRRAQAEPINLDSCLRAFTSEEELGEDEMYYCSKCKTHCLATKKLDLWRLPPILIIHLKRFQFVNGRWIKSQKIVKFPRENFDPSAFLVQRDPSHFQRKQLMPQVDSLPEPRTLQGESRKIDLQITCTPGEGDTLNRSPSSLNTTVLNNIKASPSLGRKSGTSCPSSKTSSPNSSPRTLGRGKGRLRLPQLGKNKLSSSKENLDASKENGTDQEQRCTSDQGEALTRGRILGGSQNELYTAQDNEMALVNGYICEQNAYSNGSINGQTDNHSEDDITDDQREEVCVNPIYNLYAISCHSGIMGGGHYVTYAKNPNNKWYCYNDSSCK
ncbi:UBP32 hydrolase, partial [Corythaeola cristata]|nr:UBP32 hydrolase [Corythaeola cristata]